ncbi:xanthine hydroxylase reductase [Erwinia typographi]|uniref:Xanthine hydroxylase reductase n=1 Tax=Erwinia typographi TaxID=371042 RepID=A0A0A3Z9G1_9GAMM|nr:PDR/VanB family oxidoreductase [Erwinia typographi]KGT94286.1 xanthine hydroxylase reductase [Erwinia typographi]
MMETLRVVVDALSRQGKENVAVSLVAESGQPLPEWEAGAHIDLHLDNGLIRQYSLTGSPTRRDRFLICVRLESQSRGGSRYIHERLKLGQTLTVSAPRNAFSLLPAQKIVLMAAGIGITPLLAMLESLEVSGTPFALHYYVKDRQSTALLRHLARRFQHGSCDIWYSSEGNSPRVHLPAELIQPEAGSHLYMCGPQGFMSHVKNQALAKGWQQEALHSEAFMAAAPADTTPQGDEVFTITIASSGASWPVPVDKTIAAVLQDNGVCVPLSCEMGICGACLTPVIEGRADHRDTVQSAAEKSASSQQVALCCSRSFSANLVIDL